ncbi:hypothetical protein M8J75_010600 [Diaphorina citri]|nr:hypothetical protein M8J75_010600 [Diaphorina citri]
MVKTNTPGFKPCRGKLRSTQPRTLFCSLLVDNYSFLHPINHVYTRRREIYPPLNELSGDNESNVSNLVVFLLLHAELELNHSPFGHLADWVSDSVVIGDSWVYELFITEPLVMVWDYEFLIQLRFLL